MKSPDFELTSPPLQQQSSKRSIFSLSRPKTRLKIKILAKRESDSVQNMLYRETIGSRWLFLFQISFNKGSFIWYNTFDF
jgi:hypothetical protein